VGEIQSWFCHHIESSEKVEEKEGMANWNYCTNRLRDNELNDLVPPSEGEGHFLPGTNR
jgi:hypothetical protein